MIFKNYGKMDSDVVEVLQNMVLPMAEYVGIVFKSNGDFDDGLTKEGLAAVEKARQLNEI